MRDTPTQKLPATTTAAAKLISIGRGRGRVKRRRSEGERESPRRGGDSRVETRRDTRLLPVCCNRSMIYWNELAYDSVSVLTEDRSTLNSWD